MTAVNARFNEAIEHPHPLKPHPNPRYNSRSVLANGNQSYIWALVLQERQRQDDLWGWPNNGLAGTDPHKKVAILAEEMGEVAHAVLEGPAENLVEELVQVAAVCTAWLESIRERGV